jgi:hypothetical protein
MKMALKDIDIYIYKSDGSYMEISNLISTLKYSCGLDKVSQQLDVTMAFGVYSTALPSFFVHTGQKIEVYINKTLYFKGKVETVEISVDKETISLTCYDYIRNLIKSKVCYNFSDITAYDAICKIFNDLEIPYSENGILSGKDGDYSKIQINHLIRNKSAYDACMMIATEVHRNTGIFYYMFMDVSGNINLMPCDYYWGKQTIKACSQPNLKSPDGNMISFSYKEDVSDIITKVEIYDSKGNPVDISTGASSSTDENTDEGGGE